MILFSGLIDCPLSLLNKILLLNSSVTTLLYSNYNNFLENVLQHECKIDGLVSLVDG